MAYIGSFPADKTSGAKPRDEFTGDGSTVNFTLSQEVPGGFESNVLVIVDNVIQQPVESYTIGGDNLTLQFSEAPAASAVVYVLHQGNATYQMIPVVGSVTPDKLSENLRNFTVDTFTGDGSTVAYTLTATPASANSILVIVDGIVQTKTTNYTLSSTTLTFTDAPDSSAAITVIHLGFSTVSRTAVPDGSITTAKIADNAITSAKLGFDVIVAEDIAENAITVAEIASGAVTPAKLSTGGLYWDTSSNVGIGTSSPSNLLTLGASGGPTQRFTDTTSGSFSLIQVGSNGDFTISADHGNTGASTNILFKNDGAQERMRITSAGNLQVGADGSVGTLVVSPGVTSRLSNSSPMIQVTNGGGSGVYALAGQLVISGRTTDTSTYGNIFIQTGATQQNQWTFNNGGVFVLPGGSAATTGGGITFPSTQSSSADPNTLDDYEEGTWTPSFTGLTTSGTVVYSGTYTKIGRLVFVTCQVNAALGNAQSAQNSTRVSNLPFSCSQNTGGFNWSTNYIDNVGIGNFYGGGEAYTPTFNISNKNIFGAGCYQTT
jgi:hypothetical protein